MELLKSKLSKVVAYVVASGLLVELLDIAIRRLSELDLGETGSVVAMALVNVLLVLVVKKKKALSA